MTPAFAQVRLVPLGGVGANQLRKADLTWLAHLDHLSTATRQPDCFRCQIIETWEDNGGAAAAADWLRAHDHEEVCLPHGKGGSYGGDDEFSN